MGKENIILLAIPQGIKRVSNTPSDEVFTRLRGVSKNDLIYESNVRMVKYYYLLRIIVTVGLKTIIYACKGYG